jgi:hypothetical protein
LSIQSLGRMRTALAVSAVVLLSGISATSASAAPKSFNDATVNIRGGDATAISACVNLARSSAKAHKTVQNNFCKNKAVAVGGDVTLKDVSILVAQDSSSKYASNKATVNIEGGDATAVAACVNVLQGSASAKQTNECANTAVARGGDVKLKDVDITILQG